MGRPLRDLEWSVLVTLASSAGEGRLERRAVP